MPSLRNIFKINQKRQGLEGAIHRTVLRGLRTLPIPLEHYILSTLHRKLRKLDITNYKVPINPFKVEWVNPMTITHHSERNDLVHLSWREDLGSVVDGDWDLQHDRSCFQKQDPYKIFKAHFIDGIPWNELDTSGLRDGFDKGRFSYLDRIFEDIQNNGYKSQLDLMKEGKTTRDLFLSLRHEIQVDVGRHGQLLFVDARHRLAMAQILQLPSVPVVIISRHPLWMQYLEAIYLSDQSIDHPDFRENLMRKQRRKLTLATRPEHNPPASFDK